MKNMGIGSEARCFIARQYDLGAIGAKDVRHETECLSANEMRGSTRPAIKANNLSISIMCFRRTLNMRLDSAGRGKLARRMTWGLLHVIRNGSNNEMRLEWCVTFLGVARMIRWST